MSKQPASVREPQANEETPSEEVIEAAVKAHPPTEVPAEVLSSSSGQESSPEQGKDADRVATPGDSGEAAPAAGTEEWLEKNPGVKA